MCHRVSHQIEWQTSVVTVRFGEAMLLCHLPYFFFFFADRNESGVMFPFEMFLDLLRYLLLLNNQLLLINKRKKRGWNKSILWNDTV